MNARKGTNQLTRLSPHHLAEVAHQAEPADGTHFERERGGRLDVVHAERGHQGGLVQGVVLVDGDRRVEVGHLLVLNDVVELVHRVFVGT